MRELWGSRCYNSGQSAAKLSDDFELTRFVQESLQNAATEKNAMMKQVCLTVLFFTSLVRAPAQEAGKPSAVGFKKLQSLAGEWVGRDERGGAVKTSFKIIVSNTTVMETLASAGTDEMATLYTMDGEGIALVHYCPTNNQPRMRATPQSNEVKELVFQFVGAGNLITPSTGHEHKLVLRFEDRDHITEEWTWRQDGKDSVMIYHFARKNS